MVRHQGAALEASVRAVSWLAEGAVKVIGDADVQRARLSGQISIGGKCTAEQLEVHGPLEVLGDCRVSGRLTTQGSIHVGGALEVGDLSAQGSVYVGDSARAAYTWVSRGDAHIGGSLMAGEVEFDGRLTVDGIVEAGKLHGRLVGASALRTVRAQEVILRRPGGLMPTPRGSLTVDRIEAQSVQIEYVDCEYIVAEEVRLGPHAHVTAVEGRVVERHPSARVGPESRSAPPHGLTR